MKKSPRVPLPSVRALLFLLALLGVGPALAAAPSRVLVHDEWALLSLPGDPGGASTVAALFGDDLTLEDYESTWIVFSYDPVAGTYTTVPEDGRLEPGRAYWMTQRTGVDVTIDVPARVRAPAPTQVRGCPSVVGCASTPLALADGAPFSWNMIGLPSPVERPFDDVRVTAAEGACRRGCTLVEAEAAGVMNDRLWRYVDRATGYEEVGSGDTVRPWDGFWVPVLGEAGDEPAVRLPAPPPTSSLPALAGYDRVFTEDFDGPALDPAKWKTSFLWGPYQRINAEEQLYVDTLGLHADSTHDPFVFTGEGTMKIVAVPVGDGVTIPPQPPATDPLWEDNPHGPWRHKPDFDPANVKYLSGIITSYDAFRFTHGYVETRARVPEGKGLWPAFWTLNTQYTGIAPEVDVMEYLGDDPNVVYNTYHWFDTSGPQWEARNTPSLRVVGPDYSSGFHTFGMAWEPGQIIWYVDGVETHRVASPEVDVSNQSMYLLANLAVGGYWPGSPDGTTPFPAEYELDYIHAYEKKKSIPVDLDEYELAFFDEFEGGALDPAKWNTAFVWGPFLPINRELQYYVDSLGIDAPAGGAGAAETYSPFVLDGEHLTIRGAKAGTEAPANAASVQPGPNDPFWDDESRAYGHRPNYTPPDYTSGIITSYDAFSFVEGYAEIRAKVPSGDGLWPAFWLLNRYYVGDLPEIDVMEILGEEPNRVYQSWHYNGGGTIGNISSTESRRYAADFADDFHTYGVQWMPGKIVWYVDGQVVRTVNDVKVPYQQMYVIANLALSGPPDDRSFNSKPLDDAALPAEFVIDYIRVYQERKTP